MLYQHMIKMKLINIGQEFSDSGEYYPQIFALEKNGAPNGIYGTKYDLSEQDEYITTGKSYASTIKGRYNGYDYEISTSYMDKIYVELFRYEPGERKELDQYWVASRKIEEGSVSVDGGYFNTFINFRFFSVNNGEIGTYDLFDSRDSDTLSVSALRPIVEIDLSKVNLWKTGDGTRNSPFSITAK